MSLAIDVECVRRVLLADGWHDVQPGSFRLDSYEFVRGDDGDDVHSEGDSGLCPTGYGFEERHGDYLAGPLTAVLSLESLPMRLRHV